MAKTNSNNQVEQINPYRFDCIICDITMNAVTPYYQCFCCRMRINGGFSTGVSVHKAELKILSGKKAVISPAD